MQIGLSAARPRQRDGRDVAARPQHRISGAARAGTHRSRGKRRNGCVLVDHEILLMQSVDPDSADVFNDAGVFRGDSPAFETHSEVERRTA